MTKLSIITINWNNKEGLEKTIASVLPQLSSDTEFIVVDGNSSDGSINTIKENEGLITKWISEPKLGIYADMNKGIKIAKGEYCLFLNSGDWLVENILNKILPKCTGEDIIYFNTILSFQETRFQELHYPANLTMDSFFNKTIGHQSTLIKMELFETYGLYNERNKIHSDYEFWIKSIVMGNCSIKYVNFPISYYDMGGRSSKVNDQTRREIEGILENYLPPRIIADYEKWHNYEREMKVLEWYRKNPLLYSLLSFFYKVVKNINRVL